MTPNDFLFLLSGATVTLALTAWAVFFGTLLGVLIGWLRTIVPVWVNAPTGFVLDVLRSVPLIIQLVVANAFKPMVHLNVSVFTLCCIVLSTYTAAFLSEIVRGALLSVPAVTRRAARSLGMSYWQDLAHIVFPISLRVGLSSWIGLVLSVLKDSALVLWLGVIELLKSSQILVLRLQEPLEILMLTGLIYFVMSFPLSQLGMRLERRWQKQ